MNMDENDQVIIVGGATRVPKVQEWLLKAVGKEELGKNIHADEAAAMEAVYQAAALSKAFKVKPFVVRDAAKENTCFCGAVAKKQERTIEEPSIGRRSCAILPFIETQKLFCPPQNVATIGGVRSPAMEADYYSPEHSVDGGATPVQDERDSDDEGNNRQHGSDVESPVHRYENDNSEDDMKGGGSGSENEANDSEDDEPRERTSSDVENGSNNRKMLVTLKMKMLKSTLPVIRMMSQPDKKAVVMMIHL
ncbi:CREB3 regulatory factor-like [Rana temporaria]|uniref:CREB3 regulatory factor-like n=1 Tax=Rana temporaria TaxID=8407 RepID=UPI001AACC512|nr:CREB3 regulatory factor-like [Rana temporaria]